jgi:hypothetical protein
MANTAPPGPWTNSICAVLHRYQHASIVTREAIQKWAARCTLSREPEMPAGFQGRTAGNWRPLLAIADDLGVDYSEAARAAAVVLCSDRQYENPNVTLLIDLRTVFDMYGAARLSTKRELIPALAVLEDSLWSEWTGLDDTATPHMLSPFRIRPGRNAGTKSESGYCRSQFEAAWASYCQPTSTPSHLSKIRYLSRS